MPVLVVWRQQWDHAHGNEWDTTRATVEMRDPYTAGHQLRVANLAAAIAQQMGLTEEQVHRIRLAGMVHDLGKVHIPAEILSKPGKLSRIEFELHAGPSSSFDSLLDCKPTGTGATHE